MFWNPARVDKDKQFEIDKRVILGVSREYFEQKLFKVNKKIEKQNEQLKDLDVFTITRKRRSNINRRRDELISERDTIIRRLDIINNELE